MDPLLTVIVTRAAERILVVLAGILSIWIGYRLFALVPERREGEGRMELPGGASFFLSKVGPGVFFALFGSGLIGYSATQPVSFSPGPDGPYFVEQADSAASPTSPGGFSGINPPAPAADRQANLPLGSAPREEVIATLNAWFADLPEDAASETRIDRLVAVEEAKLALMREVWDEAAWGDYDAFHRWVTVSAQSGPPPAGSEAAAAVFDGFPQ